MKGKIIRKDFSKIREVIEVGNLIEIQTKSYRDFLQLGVPPDERKEVGLQKVFKTVFPIYDFYESATLEFVEYHIGKPKAEVMECILKGLTYEAPMKVIIRLVIWDTEGEDKKGIKAIKEQDVYLGEIPLMTDHGTFIINGTERVVVSQLHRSPGVFFSSEKSGGKKIYFCRVIPYRGSWLDFEFDSKDYMYVRIDRRRKLPVTILLRALGYGKEEILNFFYESEIVEVSNGLFYKRLNKEILLKQRLDQDVVHPETGEIIARKGRKVTKTTLKKIEAAGIDRIPIDHESLLGKAVGQDVVNKKTGEVIVECNTELTEEHIEKFLEVGVSSFPILFIDNINVNPSIHQTFLIDKLAITEKDIETLQEEGVEKGMKEYERDKAMIEIYKRLRPGDLPTLETARIFFRNLFFNPDRYDLSKVGRMKLNYKLGIEIDENIMTLTIEDILAVVQYLFRLRDGYGMEDDIDHLGNRRVRTVGELVEDQFHIGMVRLERAIKEKMSLQDVETLMPHDLINSKPLTAILKEFFGSSQLSQFMDQVNPLSEITHKRRLSALGPGGLTRERAGFEVRDVHPTHYGRICPIETPEGPNIGLISSLSTYARINPFGFIETPYRVVRDGRATSEIKYLFALDEQDHVIAQANAPLDDDGRFINDLISARKGGEFVMVPPEEVDFMDVSPKQLVSVAASLIPFLEHDDANRALMGSNMQRQSVPLLKAEAPLVGTGMERIVARDSGVVIAAKQDGIVSFVDSTKIIIKHEKNGNGEFGLDVYPLTKFMRSNQNTCINQKPIVKKGQKVQTGEIIADGPATDQGELALGRNVMVAFLPWGGYNFEDSILVSEKILKEDIYTSIHIEELEISARDTKLGKEEITRDIPNVGEEALKDLDESGIIRLGALVSSGDILVGKITPKGETQLSPEEKLLRAIFGEKAGDVRDTSLRVPHGVEGVVVNVKVLSRRGQEIDERTRAIEEEERANLERDQGDEIRVVLEATKEVLLPLFMGGEVKEDVTLVSGEILGKGTKLTEEALSGVDVRDFEKIQMDGVDSVQVRSILDHMQEKIDGIRSLYQSRVSKISRGEELPPGVLKTVKVYLAMKRKLSIGDKMSGRHGNKGIISRILPEEDMPYLPDGTPVDIVLNPLGVPSRMNVGQILETHLGWAAKELGQQVQAMLEKHFPVDNIRKRLKEIFQSQKLGSLIDEASDDEILEMARSMGNGIYVAVPVFDGASEGEVKEYMDLAGVPRVGQTILFDGKTGEPFDHEVTVGSMYMLKLHHLVDDKIHARSIGPYSLVTQQPLGGKAQFGGQRFGEMEVWAMEGYGAAYSLQEFLTIKSDDVSGRTRAYEAIVKGEDVLQPGIPESFNVLVKELQSLCLDVELLDSSKMKHKEG
jgi:DNA-directed RNA polymerase subunit beta